MMQNCTEKCVFVTVPGGSVPVVTIRDLPDIFTVDHIKAQLELIAGLPSEIFILKKSNGLQIYHEEVLNYGVTLQQGSVLKLHVLPEFASLYGNVQRNQLAELKTSIQDELGNTVHQLAFHALFMAAGKGNLNICRKLANIVDITKTTRFGRNALHVAAAHDCLSVVQFLVHKGCKVKSTDHKDMSSLLIASMNGAVSCERWMRLWCLSKEGWEREREELDLSDVKKESSPAETGTRVLRTASAPCSSRPQSFATNISQTVGNGSLDFLSIQALISPRKETNEYKKKILSTKKRKSKRRTRSPTIRWDKFSETTGNKSFNEEPDRRWLPNSFSPKDVHHRESRIMTAPFGIRQKYLRPSVSEPSTRINTPRPKDKKPTIIDIQALLSETTMEEQPREKSYQNVLASENTHAVWLENKKESRSHKENEQSHTPRSGLNHTHRRVTIFRLCDTDPTPLPVTDAGEYSRSYKNWKENKSNRNEGSLNDHMCEPQTYEHWMDKKALQRRRSAPAESIMAATNNVSMFKDRTKNHESKAVRRVTWKQ